MSIEYKWTYAKYEGATTEYIDACDCCQMEVPTRIFKQHGETPLAVVDRRLCEICATTMAGSITQYKNRGETIDRQEFYKAISAVANQLLLKLGAFEKPRED